MSDHPNRSQGTAFIYNKKDHKRLLLVSRRRRRRRRGSSRSSSSSSNGSNSSTYLVMLINLKKKRVKSKKERKIHMSVAIYRCILRGIIKSHIKQELSYLLMSELIFVHEEGIFSIHCNYNDLHICWFPLDTLVIFIY